MKRILTYLFCILVSLSSVCEAKGGVSSGGGGHASSGGGHASVSSSSSSRGGFSSSTASKPSVSASTSRPVASTPATTRTTTTTTVSRSYSSRYVSPAGHYGGWGMGYGYSNGILTGLIIGGMMHPYGTVMYSGPGMYANNAVMYPNGQIVNQQGYLVGTYVNGVFTPVENGALVAQQVPADAGAQPVAVHNPVGFSLYETLITAIFVIGIIILIFVIFGLLF